MSVNFEDPNYLILLALANGPNHGTGIREMIIADTVGMHIGLSTIYACLQVLSKSGFIAPDTDSGGYRNSYHLTKAGAIRLELESKTRSRTALLAAERLRSY